MLRVTRSKVAGIVAAFIGAFALTVAAASSAFAWHDKVDVAADGCVVTITATGLTWEGKPSDHIEWKIFTAPYTQGSSPVAQGQLLPSGDNPDIALPVTLEGDEALPPGDYLLKWWLFIPGTETPEEGDAPVPFTVGACDQPPTEEPSETPSNQPSETPGDEPPVEEPPAEEPPADQGSTLPETGSGFPTGTAAAFALFLVSVGGFLLTWRRGALSLPFRRRH